LIAAFATVAAAAIPHWLPPKQQYDCVDARQKAISIAKEFPEVTKPYTGAEEDQCQLNDVVQQVSDAVKHRSNPPEPAPKR
jgi:hypothetical protein